MKSIAILGSTGSIGTQTLEVASWRGYRVTALAAGQDHELLLDQVHRFGPELVSCSESVAGRVRSSLPAGVRLVTGAEGAAEVAVQQVDCVIAAIPGMAGLAPLRAALQAGRQVALAGKEAMVVAGPLIARLLAEGSGRIIPVDSEHSALFQCLQGESADSVASLVLTASGGPFLHEPADLSGVTPAQALRHPNWSMGPKVTVDSATLFNKGLEVLEAHALFGVPLGQIEVVIHPQSLVHGLVRFTDGQIKAQIGPHDMRLPIQYGIEYPERPPTPLAPLPLTGMWQFSAPDLQRFPALALAYEAGRQGGLAPAYLNAADEIAVSAFLEGQIPFTGISRVLEQTLAAAEAGPLTWDSVVAADQAARELARELVLRTFSTSGRGG
jgi:1-deoxy-D-xylulose-5-phosphate reductoisomerase